MRYLTAFLRFWYDFIVGDAWEIAAGVVIALAAGTILAQTEVVPREAVPLLVAGVIVLVVGTSLFMEARKRVRA